MAFRREVMVARKPMSDAEWALFEAFVTGIRQPMIDGTTVRTQYCAAGSKDGFCARIAAVQSVASCARYTSAPTDSASA